MSVDHVRPAHVSEHHLPTSPSTTMDDDDSNPPYFQVSFSADPTKMPVISTDPDADLRERKEDSEHEVEKHPLPQQTTIDEDKIEKNPAPKKTAKRNKGKNNQPPKPVPVVDSEASLTLSELEDEDTELWLIAVPRHDSVRATLPGSKFSFPPSSPKSSPESPSKSKTSKREREQDNNKVGVLRGSYVYQEVTSPESKNMRAVFVVKDESGKSRLEVGT